MVDVHEVTDRQTACQPVYLDVRLPCLYNCRPNARLV